MLKRVLLFIAGCFCMIIGAVGIVLPMLPTTPLVLLAALCFYHGSPRMHKWLKESPYFGPYIENFYTKKGIPLRQKVISISFLWVSLFLSAVIVNALYLRLILAVVGVCVTIHLLKIKTKQT